MADGQEQNRSEAATPSKLKSAREKGQVARSMELGFIAGLMTLSAFVQVAGAKAIADLAQAMRIALSSGIAHADEPAAAAAARLIGDLAGAAIRPVLLFGGTMIAVVIFVELVQLRGFIFTAKPLKPDWSRLNPAKGLKRLFTARMLKETLKSIVKFALYGVATWLVIRFAVGRYGTTVGDGERLAETLRAVTMRLVFAFMLLGVGIAILDQLLVRGEFAKQMRMSRREVTRESREREGEPRIKQRRKRLHGEMVAQGASTGALAGSDMLVVNPEHFAVALRYDDATMAAPIVATRGRNLHALRLKGAAYRRGIPVVRDPPLARALYRACGVGATIPPAQFDAVAALYIALRRSRPASTPATHSTTESR
ncbi:MAG TPA: EscU/YscU/HrcU family type III secretion system export apparatus switch protein [Sphingomonas sp.]|jgi:flagellar biosynthetic protein FlhB|nr:EscU/YscU/HrcU family type III secretion system export apparatus switch protein [Sphingomonas sp.]